MVSTDWTRGSSQSTDWGIVSGRTLDTFVTTDASQLLLTNSDNLGV